MSLDIASYAAAQKQRLEEIRRATEKERQLLTLHASKMVHDTETSRYQSVSAGQMYQTANESGSRWLTLNEKAMELHALDEKLTQEEKEAELQSFQLERRLHAAERKKSELLAQLTLLQHREELLRKEEAQLEENESAGERESRLLDALAQEVEEEQRSMNDRANDKRARLSVANTAAREKQKKREAIEARTRAHLNEVQDRIRMHRMETMRRSSGMNDTERRLRQEQSRVREEELAAIYRLRKEIESISVLIERGDANY